MEGRVLKGLIDGFATSREPCRWRRVSDSQLSAKERARVVTLPRARRQQSRRLSRPSHVHLAHPSPSRQPLCCRFLAVMTVTAAQKSSLIACLQASLATNGDIVLSSSSPAWREASAPYNRRLSAWVEPLALAYPSTPDAIAIALGCARSAGGSVGVQARSGGHNYGAFAMGGRQLSSSTLTLDLRRFADIAFSSGPDGTIDGIARVGSGVMLGELAHALERRGRAMPHGSCPTVGVGGQVRARRSYW